MPPSPSSPHDPGWPCRPGTGPGGWTPGRAYWNHREVLAARRERIQALCQAVGHPEDLCLAQYAQLMAAALEFAPELILELGRGYGNSTCAFTEAANQLEPQRCRVLSICLSEDWQRQTVPRLLEFVSPRWLEPLTAVQTNILTFDFRTALAGTDRMLIFWDAHGFDVAECVLGSILPEVAGRQHLVIMHDITDARYNSAAHDQYHDLRLWKGSSRGTTRLRLGCLDSDVEQVVSALDFTTRNRLTLHSADFSFDQELGQEPERVAAMERLLGPELFSLRAHWFWFSLNQHPGPYTFPRFQPPQSPPPRTRSWFRRWLRAG